MGAKLPDLETLWQAGINPKNGLPTKFGSSKCTIKKKKKKQKKEKMLQLKM